MNSKSIALLIIGFLALIIIFSIKQVSVYGLINENNVNTNFIDCELVNSKLLIITPIESNLNGKSVLLNGLTLFNLFFVDSINESYNPQTACFIKHEKDINLEVLAYELSNNVPSLVIYNLTNNQDQRLFYECRLLTDCVLERDYFTGYINPGEEIKIYFNVTCKKGVHNSTIKTVFVDELVNYHTIEQQAIINSI